MSDCLVIEYPSQNRIVHLNSRCKLTTILQPIKFLSPFVQYKAEHNESHSVVLVTQAKPNPLSKFLQLKHVVPISDTFCWNKNFYYCQPFPEAFATQMHFSAHKAFQLLVNVTDALEELQKQNIMHRQISLENIFYY